MATEDDVRELALALPGTVEKPSYGMPGFRVRDRLFARIREEGVLVLWCESIEEKEFLIEGEPEKFFTVPHYDGHPHVLVRLGAVDREELAELLAESFRIRAAARSRALHEAGIGFHCSLWPYGSHKEQRERARRRLCLRTRD